MSNFAGLVGTRLGAGWWRYTRMCRRAGRVAPGLSTQHTAQVHSTLGPWKLEVGSRKSQEPRKRRKNRATYIYIHPSPALHCSTHRAIPPVVFASLNSSPCRAGGPLLFRCCSQLARVRCCSSSLAVRCCSQLL